MEIQNVARRRFLLQGGATAASALLARTAGAGTTRQPAGIQLYTVGAELQKDVPGTLRQLRRIGYREVETAGFAGLGAKQFRQQLDDAGLVCPSVHLQLNSGALASLLDDAKVVGAHSVVCSALLPSGAARATVNDYKKMAARLNVIGGMAKQAGLQYAYHNHNMEFAPLDGGAMGYDILLAETDKHLVCFEIDCGWMIAAGHRPEEYFRRYPQRIRMLHIKDFLRGSAASTSLAGALRPQGTELGRGYIDYKPILAAAVNIHIEHYFVEQEPPFPDMPAIEAAAADYAYLHALHPFA
ncbi:sugar phosphate isomerase/epimerase [Acidipila sp. EB88]|uniref:sugar phosphate isomerase/epimerase family protein n=1 Tax=Acidipila sp. EB88 TaxID=2305226 RepID=UPI000F5E021E|nr:sugar phosphate isomerase/epimerase [Acidipila sp. EB88]RRA49128.1 sugar phosphate isomerase/epimerase [Acidipila sp. EB88]